MLRRSGIALCTVLLVVAGVGCAIMPKPTPMQMAEMLVTAGFQAKTADTAEKLERLKALKQEIILRHDADGKPVYLYADAVHCNCLYTGDEAAYASYRKLAKERKHDYKVDLYSEQDQDRNLPSGWQGSGWLGD